MGLDCISVPDNCFSFYFVQSNLFQNFSCKTSHLWKFRFFMSVGAVVDFNGR